jgi:hypothetical protein
MWAELILTEQVRCWVERVAPGESLLADAAVAKALTSYAAGASVSEACREARRLVESRLRHPSSTPVSSHRILAAATASPQS